MKFHEGRMREFTKEHIKILEKILNNNGECRKVRCYKCPFSSVNNKYNADCGSLLYGTITRDAGERIQEMNTQDRNRRIKQIILDVLRQQDKDYRIKELEKRVDELESDVKKLKMTPIDIALKKINSRKFDYVKPQDTIDKYKLTYNTSKKVWSAGISITYIDIGANLFTYEDAIFLVDILNEHHINLNNINEILGGIKYE